MSPLNVEIIHRNHSYRMEDTSLARYGEWIMKQVGSLAPSFNWSELSIILTDDTIRDLNREWFGKDNTTDVISFAYPPVPPESGHTGEVILNLQQAHEEGRLRKSPDDELAFYLAHGCHHLMGAEDETPAQKKAMLTLERDWVSKAQSLGLGGPFFL